MRKSPYTHTASRYILHALHLHLRRYGTASPLGERSSRSRTSSPEASMALLLDVERALASLPDGERTVTALTVIDGHTDAAAAAILGIPTRRATLWRTQALDRLAIALAGY